MLDPEAASVLRDVCSVIVQKGSKYLLVQENQLSVRGKWNLPGGHRDEGETLEEAAVREAREETGYEVKIMKPLFSTERPADQRRLNAFLAEIIGGKLQVQTGEILAVRWFTYAEILAIQPSLRNSDYVIGAIAAAENL